MFDLIGFGLIVAQQVLSSLIHDFIQGRRRAAGKRELESLVSQKLEQHGPEVPKVDIRKLNSRVLSEIRSLADQDPDLDVGRFQAIRPASSLVIDDNQADQQNALLVERMHRLDALVTQRRRSLGLPIADPHPETDAPIDMETVKIPDNGDYWSRRLQETQEKIVEARQRPGQSGESGE